jgi:hypothetical protein
MTKNLPFPAICPLFFDFSPIDKTIMRLRSYYAGGQGHFFKINLDGVS